MNVKDRLLLEYSDVSDGETRAGELCPACKGGRTGERTLSITRSGGALLWHCHRASCDFGGGGGSKVSNARALTQVPNSRGIVGRQYVRTAEQLPSAVRERLTAELFITERHVTRWGLGWDGDTQSVVQPVRDRHQEDVGCALRAPPGDTRRPKSKSHTEAGAIAWFPNHATPGLIIVEDIYSAIRAADFMSSVALLSTHLNDERIEQIRGANVSGPVYLALDADAFPKTIKYVQAFRSRLSMQPVKLIKDLKDLNPQELEEFFNDL